MGFFNQDNTPLETAWFSVLAIVSFLCFPFGVKLARRFPQIVVVKLVPVLCLLLSYENVILALSNVLDGNSRLVEIGRISRAAVIPVFLVVMFEVAYAVHKRRSVKFCGIVFDQGHRRSVEPCSWFLRNFVRIVGVMLFVVGILVHFNAIVGNDEKAGGTGLVDTEDASAHLLLALLPTTGMALIALYIAIYMWKYGNDASIVVQSTICNGWMFLFLGTLALLGGQVPPEWCFRVVNEMGQVLLLLSLIAIGREIGKEVQAADDFSSFLEKENELEVERGASALTTAASAIDGKILASTSSTGGMDLPEPHVTDTAEHSGRDEVSPGPEEVGAGVCQDGEDVEGPTHANREVTDANLDDVLSSRERRAGRCSTTRGGGSGQGTSGQGRSLSGLFGHKRGGSLLSSRADEFGVMGDEAEGVGDVRMVALGNASMTSDEGGRGLLHPGAGISSSGAPSGPVFQGPAPSPVDVTASVARANGRDMDRMRRRGVDVV